MGRVIRKKIEVKKLVVALKTATNLETQVGWFSGIKHISGIPVARLAALHEYGSTRTHPGGTKYIIGQGGVPVFVKSNYAGKVAGVTKPHTITVPPRPFMRPTISEKNTAWKALAISGTKAVLAGNNTMQEVMVELGLAAAGDIGKFIMQITSPPLDPSTIRARFAKRSKGKGGDLSKPLVDSGFMLRSLTSTVVNK